MPHPAPPEAPSDTVPTVAPSAPSDALLKVAPPVPSDALPEGLPAADERIDTRGLRCPLPILRAKKALAHLASGQVLAVETTDPHAAGDFEAFCRQTGNALLAQQALADGALVHYLRRR